MIAHWRPLFDPCFDNAFVVLPLTGTLVSVDGDLDALLRRRAVALSGLRAANRMPDAYFARGAIVDLAPDACRFAPGLAAKATRRLVRLLLATLSLALAVRVLDAIVPLRARAETADIDGAMLAALAAAFGRRSRDDCLEMALCRHAWLRLHGIRSAICIGLLAPSDEMHAWVEHRGRPLLECEDVLAHYQACLIFVTDARA